MHAKIQEINAIGQSIWYDNIQRAMLDDGRMQALITQGVSGLTSNPTIFEKAIAHSMEYDVDLDQLVAQGSSVEEIYENLVSTDIGRAADLLLPVYERTEGRDGYASLEVNPLLAHQTDRTVTEALGLFSLLARPNLMIKVPASLPGLMAIERLIGQGINVNVTLIFSVQRYRAVAEAYLKGLERLVQAGKDPARVASVASFFVSRVDAAVDEALDAVGTRDAVALKGQIGIANSRVAYQAFSEIFSGSRWESLTAQGARAQRPLWASTSTKDPTLPDTFYVDALAGPQTVNTLPPATLDAWLDHGQAVDGLTGRGDEAQAQLVSLAGLGVDLAAITARLEKKGVGSFSESYISLLNTLGLRRVAVAAC